MTTAQMEGRRRLVEEALRVSEEHIGCSSAVIGLARSLKLRVVAEGVETLDELGFLRAQGCDEAQGYLFGRPVPPWQFARLIEAGKQKQASTEGSPMSPEPAFSLQRGPA